MNALNAIGEIRVVTEVVVVDAAPLAGARSKIQQRCIAFPLRMNDGKYFESGSLERHRFASGCKQQDRAGA